MHTEKSRAKERPDGDSRRALADALPEALAHAIGAYRRHARSDPGEDAKAFQQHQSACKAALQHIETLLKLRAAITTETAACGTPPADMLSRAEAAFTRYTEEKDE